MANDFFWKTKESWARNPMLKESNTFMLWRMRPFRWRVILSFKLSFRRA